MPSRPLVSRARWSSLIVLATVLMLSACVGGTAPWRCAVDGPKLPGRGVRGACEPFARGLCSRMRAAGHEAHLIAFAWRRGPRGPGDGAAADAHVICAWRDGNEWWAQDNLTPLPVWLTEAGQAANDLTLARSFAGPRVTALLPVAP